jgi:ribonuclease/clavin/mitogillin
MKMAEAVSVVLRYQNEIFAIVRQNNLPAFPGYTAFPGGKVDKADLEMMDDPFQLDKGHFAAIRRELIEEINWDINKKLDSITLKKLGVAVTPDFNPYRFATSFYEVELKEKVQFNFDENEIKSGAWDTAEKILNEYKQAQRAVIPPILKIFEYYHQKEKVLPELNFQFELFPVLETIRGVKQIFIKSNTLPPASYTNCFLLGDQCDVIVDPSPYNLEEYEKLKLFLKDYKIRKVFLTHHHPDHCEYANKLASDLNIPIYLSFNTYLNIFSQNPSWFNHIKYFFIQDSEILTYTRGIPVLVMEVPGHDNGQLAPYASDFRWFIAGDLFQGQGTVVIGEPEGDMNLYMNTLKKVIDLNPDFLFPSHGIVLGGTNILQKTLKHRLEREEEVFKYAQENKSIDDMLELIYPELDEKLKKYALKNIKAHMKKLKIENRI